MALRLTKNMQWSRFVRRIMQQYHGKVRQADLRRELDLIYEIIRQEQIRVPTYLADPNLLKDW